MKIVNFYVEHNCSIREKYSEEQFLNIALLSTAFNSRVSELKAEGVSITNETLSSNFLEYNDQNVPLDEVFKVTAPAMASASVCDNCLLGGWGFLRCRGQVKLPFDSNTIDYLTNRFDNVQNKELLKSCASWISRKKVDGEKSMAFLNENKSRFLNEREIFLHPLYDTLFFQEKLDRDDLFNLLVIMDAVEVSPISTKSKGLFNFFKSNHDKDEDICVLRDYGCQIKLNLSGVEEIYSDDMIRFLFLMFLALKSGLNMKFALNFNF